MTGWATLDELMEGCRRLDRYLMRSSVMSPLQRRVVTPRMPREVPVRRSRLSHAGSWCGSIEARLGVSVDVVQEDNGYMSAYQPGVKRTRHGAIMLAIRAIYFCTLVELITSF